MIREDVHGAVVVRDAVSHLIDKARGGDSQAADRLLAAYIPRLMEMARNLRIARNSTSAGGSDFVSSACLSFWRALVQGRLASCRDHDDLWPVLVEITLRKARSHARAEMAQKRGGGDVINVSAVSTRALDTARPVPVSTRGREPLSQSPGIVILDDDVAAELDATYACHDFLRTLPNDLREIAVLKLLGYRNADIAHQLGCAERTIERKLQLIRLTWDRDSP